MGLNVLIAEPHEVRRVGLRTVFLQDARVSNVYEATDDESLKALLHCCHLDLVVINQSLITEITALPRQNFVILAAESDMAVLRAAYEHNARGYLSVNVSAELLRTMLHPAENSFLIEPTLVPWFLDQI